MEQEHHADTTHSARPTAAATATVDIHFEGLFFFCFKKDAHGNPEECEAGVVTLAPGHELSVMVIETRSDGTEMSQVVTYPPLMSRLFDRLDITSTNAIGGMTLNGGNTKVDRTDHSLNKEYFGWVIDFENDEMHNKSVFRTKHVFKPVIHINAGEFYTARISDAFYNLTGIAGTHIKEFGHVAKTIGLRITLDRGGETSIKLGLQTLTLREATGSTYKVCFDNRRPEHKKMDTESCFKHAHAHAESDAMVMPVQILSDVQYYYHAFGLSPFEWLDFKFNPLKSLKPRGVDPAICYPGTGGQTFPIS